ncbi:MAG: hypothetical protein HC827_02950 [Cyanobacteria bacterium RM1_2_2]|nr:hypothetical protein [Cyanobacteria bacterium RM1_2_2]
MALFAGESAQLNQVSVRWFLAVFNLGRVIHEGSAQHQPDRARSPKQALPCRSDYKTHCSASPHATLQATLTFQLQRGGSRLLTKPLSVVETRVFVRNQALKGSMNPV